MVFEPPSWRALCRGARPPDRDAVEMEPGTVRRGWQHEAASRVERETILPFLDAPGQALLRSQSGPTSGAALAAAPSNYSTRIDADLFRVLLLRRLRLPLPPVSRACRCGHLLDSFGHHRAAYSRAGVLGRRGLALESAVEYKFIQNHFHPKRENFIQNHFHPKPVSSQTTFIPLPLSSKTTFIPMPFSSKTTCIPNPKINLIPNERAPLTIQNVRRKRKRNDKGRTVNIVRVCVKASPAEGRRRLHTNTAHARLSGFYTPSCGALRCLGFGV